jgi:glycosyltransferase involved in cell wall biosynthesis
MKIAIDARFYGSGHTGLGRYTTNVMKYLPKYLPAQAGLQGYTLQVLLRDSEYDNFPVGKNIVKVHAEIPHYSLAEQLQLPGLLADLKSDLLYTFHFNTPIFSKIPKIVTVHDLIKTHFTGPDTTTRSPWLFALKRSGYNWVIQKTLTTSLDIIVPTNTVKNDILAAFGAVKPERIHPVPEAPDEIFRSASSTNSLTLPQNYLLFVGNVYPHKNLSVLLEAMKSLPNNELVIVAKPSPFLSRVLAPFDQTRIHILSNLKDSELVEVYRRSSLLVTPSLMEGYGLVGLESLMVGTPVVASNIPVYREVYGDNVTYFDPRSVDSLIKAIQLVKSNTSLKPFKFTRTWDDVAKSIAEVINARCSSL